MTARKKRAVTMSEEGLRTASKIVEEVEAQEARRDSSPAPALKTEHDLGFE